MDFTYKNINSIDGFGNDILFSILKARGIKDINKFLNVDESVIEDFMLYDNIVDGGELYLNHINSENKISILVDFDFDGFSSASEIYMYTEKICEKLNKKCNLKYINHTHKSHGLDNDVMKDIINSECKLVIIPDAGSNDYKQHSILKKQGIDILILDHHKSDRYSDDAIVINNQLSNRITNKAMVGVGVVYKFCKYIDSILNVNIADDYLDLVATGLVGDHADLKSLEARYYVLKGLKLIENKTNKNKLISAIYTNKAYSMNNKATIGSVAWYLCPSVNCIIRGGSAEDLDDLFKAFINSNETRVDTIRGKGDVEISIQDYIMRRYAKLKRLQDKEVSKSVDLLSEQVEKYNLNKSEIMVIDGRCIKDNTYNRVVVNKLSDKYKKHAMLLTNVKHKNNILGGSVSGCSNKDIVNLRQWCIDSNLFIFSAGHPMAFGCQISEQNVQKLYNLINTIPSEDILTYLVDSVYNDTTLNSTIIKTIASFSDFWGNEVDEPLFAIEDIIVPKDKVFIMGKTKTTLKIIHNGIDFIKFRSSEDEYNDIMKNDTNKFTMVGRFKVNNYNNVDYPQVIIENYKFEKSESSIPFKF